jgi:hypothetical protein
MVGKHQELTTVPAAVSAESEGVRAELATRARSCTAVLSADKMASAASSEVPA